MRIAICTDSYAPALGGLEQSTQTQAKALMKLGHEVIVFCPGNLQAHHDPDWVVRLPSLPFLQFNPDGQKLYLAKPGYIAKMACKYQFDIVHAQSEFGSALFGIALARRQHIPVVLTSHTIMDEQIRLQHPKHATAYKRALFAGLIAFGQQLNLGSPKAQLKLFIKPVLRDFTLSFANSCDALFTPSEHLQSKLQAAGLRVPGFVVPNGLDLSGYEPREISNSKTVSVVWCGRLMAEKRPLDFLAAVTQLRTLDPAAFKRLKVTMIGYGHLEAACRDFIEEHNLADYVSFLGRQPNKVVHEYMAQADIFALTSYKFDNQPVVILEAAANSLAILYNDPDLTECLSPDNALLTKPSPAAIAEGLSELIANDERRQGMQKASWQAVQAFDTMRIMKRQVSIYQELIDSHPGTP